jgi:branched-chain amino acid transport system permease protein
MDAIFLQILNGLDKGGAYALIALGLTLVFGTLGVVNFAHGALFMLGAFCAVTLRTICSTSLCDGQRDRERLSRQSAQGSGSLYQDWFGPDVAATLINWSVPLSVLVAVVVMAIVGIVMERGLIKHFYKRPHADQILVTFGLAIVLQEIVKHYYGANPIPQTAPDAYRRGQCRCLVRHWGTSFIRGGG